MPVPRGELEPDVVARSELAHEGAHETDKKEDHADNDMRAVEAGRHEEGRAIDRILKAERRVDIFICLGEHEQHAEGDPERKKILEFLPVALSQSSWATLTAALDVSSTNVFMSGNLSGSMTSVPFGGQMPPVKSSRP